MQSMPCMPPLTKPSVSISQALNTNWTLALNHTLAPNSSLWNLNKSNDVTRTMSSLLLRKFALHMGVISAYGHLGTLQNVSASVFTSMPRMLVLVFLPGATLMQILGDYSMLLLAPLNGRKDSWKFSVMAAAGLHVPYSTRIHVSSKGGGEQTVTHEVPVGLSQLER